MKTPRGVVLFVFFILVLFQVNGSAQTVTAIKPGQFADIIAVAENPLENINTLKKVSFVMKNGKILSR